MVVAMIVAALSGALVGGFVAWHASAFASGRVVGRMLAALVDLGYLDPRAFTDEVAMRRVAFVMAQQRDRG